MGPPALGPRHFSVPKMQLRTFIVKSQASGDLVRGDPRGAAHDVPEPWHLAGGRPGYLSKSALPRAPLMSRERVVLQFVAEGKSTKEIARIRPSGISRPQFAASPDFRKSPAPVD